MKFAHLSAIPNHLRIRLDHIRLPHILPEQTHDTKLYVRLDDKIKHGYSLLGTSCDELIGNAQASDC